MLCDLVYNLYSDRFILHLFFFSSVITGTQFVSTYICCPLPFQPLACSSVILQYPFCWASLSFKYPPPPIFPSVYHWPIYLVRFLLIYNLQQLNQFIDFRICHRFCLYGDLQVYVFCMLSYVSSEMSIYLYNIQYIYIWVKCFVMMFFKEHTLENRW